VQVEKQLDAVVSAGLLQRDDFNDRIMAALRGMQVSRPPMGHVLIWIAYTQVIGEPMCRCVAIIGTLLQALLPATTACLQLDSIM
jgi:hypothetical protein